MQLFIGDINTETAILNKEESFHFSKVLRRKVNDEIYVTNGEGTLIKGKVVLNHPKFTEVSIDERWDDFEKKNYNLHLAIAPPKTAERLDFLLEKTVEIGIDEISFLETFHSERRKINLERCNKIAQSAAKQSLKAFFPKINDIVKFSSFIQSEHYNEKFIAHCYNDFERSDLKSVIRERQNTLILIGSEGDFSKDEIKLAQENGFKGISLGKQRFRTETAALEVCFAFDWINKK